MKRHPMQHAVGGVEARPAQDERREVLSQRSVCTKSNLVYAFSKVSLNSVQAREILTCYGS